MIARAVVADRPRRPEVVVPLVVVPALGVPAEDAAVPRARARDFLLRDVRTTAAGAASSSQDGS
jgi:hypothetical protein